jgi:hypothetical protein
MLDRTQRGLDWRTAREPDEIGAAVTVETSVVTQQHVEGTALSQYVAQLGKTAVLDRDDGAASQRSRRLPISQQNACWLSVVPTARK